MGRMNDLDVQLKDEATYEMSDNEFNTLPQILQDEIRRVKGAKPQPLGELGDLPTSVLTLLRTSANEEFEEAVQQKFQHAKSVLLQKHKDYGPKNIAQAPGGALNGLRVRMWDKMARINNLTESGAEPENESLKDSFLDLANYAIIAMLVLDNEWPNE